MGPAAELSANEPRIVDLLGGGIDQQPSPNTPAHQYADPREVFLARAAARDRLVQSGEMDLDEAIEGLIPAFCRLCPCTCERELYESLIGPPTSAAKETHQSFKKKMAPGGEIDRTLRGRS
jgi:hypothetical protein